jgi:excisionase family DNA binding protein
MRVAFDRSADASYIKLSDRKIEKTIPVSDYCNVDLDDEGKVVGIELLFISQYMDDFKLWLELASAAEYLDKSEITLRRWVKDGGVPYYRLGREYLFIKEELDEFIKKHKKA